MTDEEKKIAELEKEKCELLGIIQGKDKVIQELEKENVELKQYAKALEETDNTNILHCMKVNGKLYKAKKIIRNCLNLWNNVMTEETVRAFIKEAEQFLNSEVEE